MSVSWKKQADLFSIFTCKKKSLVPGWSEKIKAAVFAVYFLHFSTLIVLLCLHEPQRRKYMWEDAQGGHRRGDKTAADATCFLPVSMPWGSCVCMCVCAAFRAALCFKLVFHLQRLCERHDEKEQSFRPHRSQRSAGHWSVQTNGFLHNTTLRV